MKKSYNWDDERRPRVRVEPEAISSIQEKTITRGARKFARRQMMMILESSEWGKIRTRRTRSQQEGKNGGASTTRQTPLSHLLDSFRKLPIGISLFLDSRLFPHSFVEFCKRNKNL